VRLRSWLEAHPRLVVRGLIGLLLAVVVAESCLLYLQSSANRAAEVQSARLLSTFLQGDTAQVSRQVGVPIRMQNVRFKWSDKVYIDTGDLAVRAMPLRGSVVNFDDLDSFVLTMQQSEVRVHADVLEGMFNESVFNYPGSKLRELKVTMTEEDGKPKYGRAARTACRAGSRPERPARRRCPSAAPRGRRARDRHGATARRRRPPRRR